MSEPLTFDLTLAEEPVIVGDVTYTLREATGDISVKYQNMLVRSTRPSIDGKATQFTTELSKVEPMLVSLCLFDSEGKNVPETVIRSWPSRVQKSLYKKIKEISELDDTPDEDETKNE